MAASATNAPNSGMLLAFKLGFELKGKDGEAVVSEQPGKIFIELKTDVYNLEVLKLKQLNVMYTMVLAATPQTLHMFQGSTNDFDILFNKYVREDRSSQLVSARHR